MAGIRRLNRRREARADGGRRVPHAPPGRKASGDGAAGFSMEGDRGFHIVRWRASGESALGGACHALGEAGGLLATGPPLRKASGEVTPTDAAAAASSLTTMGAGFFRGEVVATGDGGGVSSKSIGGGGVSVATASTRLDAVA